MLRPAFSTMVSPTISEHTQITIAAGTGMTRIGGASEVGSVKRVSIQD